MYQKDFSSMLQNILVLLCFSNKTAPLLINSFKLEYFGNQCYRDIAMKAHEHYNEFKETPGKHIYEYFETILEGRDLKKAKLYADTLNNLWANQGDVNEEYTLKQLEKFISYKALESAFQEGSQLFDDGKIEDAWTVFTDAQKQKINLFNPGTRINYIEKVVDSLINHEAYVSTGIKELDRLGICPTPKELFVITALSGKGKTWFLLHLAKHAYISRKPDGSRYKILHISLEMSESLIHQRYLQNFLCASKRPLEAQSISYFEEDSDGSVNEIKTREITPKFTFRDDDAEKRIRDGAATALKHDNLIMKEFPTGMLTINDLKAYLDGLENYHNFKPDILFLDYPDLMKLPADNLRVATGNIYKDLRGIAVEREIAVVAPCQANRAGDGAQLITRKFMNEDYSKIATCDNHVTYNQTSAERQQGLARLYVDKCRNEETGNIILISQKYHLGQFCLGSTRFNKRYNPETGSMVVEA